MRAPEVDVLPDVALRGDGRLTGVDPHADAQLGARKPGVGGERTLSLERSFERVVGAGKSVEQGVSLGVDLDTVVGRQGLAQQAAVGREGIFVGGAEGVEQARGALDVGELEGDGA
jgi:hypothetical protein